MCSRNFFLPLIFLFTIFANTAISHATPLRLDYTVTDLGGSYQYDFDLVLDNNDGSWVSGQQFDWFVIGDATIGNNSPFTESIGFFTSLPSGWTATSTIGGHNGPSLGAVDGSVILPGYSPLALGDYISFSGVSATLIPDGDLLWSNLQGSFGASLASFEVANNISAVPLPAALPLFVVGLSVLGFAGWRRSKSA